MSILICGESSETEKMLHNRKQCTMQIKTTHRTTRLSSDKQIDRTQLGCMHGYDNSSIMHMLHRVTSKNYKQHKLVVATKSRL